VSVAVLVVLEIAPGMRQPRASGEVDEPPRRGGRARSDYLDSDALEILQRLATAHEVRQDEVGERAVLEEEGTQGLAVDRDVAHRLRDHRGEKRRLAGQQAHLAEETRCPVADDLPPCGVLDGRLPLADGDEGVAQVASLEQRFPDGRAPFLAVSGEGGELEVG